MIRKYVWFAGLYYKYAKNTSNMLYIIDSTNVSLTWFFLIEINAQFDVNTVAKQLLMSFIKFNLYNYAHLLHNALFCLFYDMLLLAY